MKRVFSLVVFIYSFFPLQAQNQVWLGVNTQEAVDFIVTDQWGRRTGKDPRNGSSFYEIPGSNYSLTNYGDDSWPLDFSLQIVTPMEDGSFTIKFIGDTLSKFNLYFRATPESDTYPSLRVDVETFLDKGAEMTYKFTYNGTSSAATKVEKVIAITSLGQDITAGGKLNLVGNQTFVNSLVSQCNQMATYFNAGNKRSAHNTLNAIKYSIQTAFSNPTATQLVNDYANTVLMEDIQLTYQLINCQNCPSTERLQK